MQMFTTAQNNWPVNYHVVERNATSTLATSIHGRFSLDWIFQWLHALPRWGRGLSYVLL